MKKYFRIILYIMLAILLMQCQKKKKDNTMLLGALLLAAQPSTANNVEMNIDLKLVSLFQNDATSSSIKNGRQTTGSTEAVVASLSAFNMDTNTKVDGSPFEWRISLDPNSLDMKSQKTIVLLTGKYNFSISLDYNKQQYAGSTNGYQLKEGTNNVPIEVRPIIGETVTDITKISELPSFSFQNNVGQLINFTDPKIGIIVDGDAKYSTENKFRVNGTVSDLEYFVNITEGVKIIRLRYYDGDIQKGTSIPAQEVQNVIKGNSISMDIVPLTGLMSFTLNPTNINLTTERALTGTLTMTAASSIRWYMKDQTGASVCTEPANSCTIDWFVQVTDGSMVSTKTIALEPSTYSFSLSITDGTSTYKGTKNNITITKESKTPIAIDISP
jgi:hypothetical protein